MSLLAKSITKAFDRFAPLSLACSWDNTGWLINVQPSSKQTTCVLTIDLTRAVMNALPPNVGVIVSYHPSIFAPLKSLNSEIGLQSCLMECIRRNIAVYCPHTSLDCAADGINEFLALGLGDGTTRKITEKGGAGQKGAGEGAIRTLDQPVPVEDLIERVKNHLSLKTVMLARGSEKPIQTIAICAGSGGGMLQDVKADAWLTGEAQHHELLAATAKGVNVILCNHSNTERPYLKHLKSILEKELVQIGTEDSISETSEWKVVISEADKDPIEYV